MQIKLFCSTWGMTRPNLEANLRKIAGSNYQGVELVAPATADERTALRSVLDELKLELVVQIHSRGRTPADHLDSLKQQIEAAAQLRPKFVNAHSGKDHYSVGVNAELIGDANAFAEGLGVSLLHETHRGRATFSAPATAQLIEMLPGLLLTADFSHWCCVHESLLHDQEERMSLAISRTRHIHARVGHTQASQVPDPRVPEWSYAVDRHLQWWDTIVKLRHEAGDAQLSICPEFGPYPYMVQQPSTRQDIVNLWDVNAHMRDLLQARYAQQPR